MTCKVVEVEITCYSANEYSNRVTALLEYLDQALLHVVGFHGITRCFFLL